MSTETLGGDPAVIVIADRASEALKKAYVNSSALALVEGQPVYLHTDGTVKVCPDGSKIPLGIVVKGGAVGAKVTVLIAAIAIVSANIAVALSAGVELESDGTVTADGRPTYSGADSGDYVHAILLQATTDVNQTARIAIIPAYQKN